MFSVEMASIDELSFAEQQMPSAILTGINFSILTDTEAEKISVSEIETSSEVTDPKLGMPNPTSHCPTCGANNTRTCEGHFGVIRFPFTILHPYFLSEIAQILNKICPGCKSIRHDKGKSADSMSRQHCRYCDGNLKNYPRMKFKVSTEDMFVKTTIIVEVKEKLLKKSRNKGYGGVMASDYWDIIPKDPHEEESFANPTRRILSHAQVYHMLKDVDPGFLKESFLRNNPLVLNCFLVTPNCHRVTELGVHVVFDERTRAFKKLVGFRGTPNELSSLVMDCLNKSRMHTEKSSPQDSASSMSGLKHVKELLLGKRNDYCFRMVVIGNPSIKLGEIGIPRDVAERLQISEQLNYWNHEKLSTCCNLRILKKGEIYVRRKDQLVSVTFDDYLQIGDAVCRPLSDGDIVLINRPPSIHQHSLIALSVKVLPVDSVLSINPLICSPFRGDFDGDCLHGYVPQTIESRVELQELVALERQLINAQSGRNLLSLSHDSLTAAHLVLEDGVHLNLLQMQQFQMFCPRQMQLPAIAKAPFIHSHQKASLPNACFWTGKQLFSLLLPPDLDYTYPSNGVHICKGEFVSSTGGSSWLRDANGNLFYYLMKHCKHKVLDFLHAAQEVLCEWLSMRGLSVSLSDLYLSSDSYSRENMIHEVSYGLREAEEISHAKLLMVDSNKDFLIGTEGSLKGTDFGAEHMCYEKQKSAALSQVSVSAFKKVFWDIQNLAYQYASKDNSLLAMLKAGSKGNLLKLVQHSMCVGLQHALVPLSFRIPHQLSCAAWNNHRAPTSTNLTQNVPEFAGRFIPYAVVQNSFLTGLNPLECFVHSLTTRDSSFSDNADLPGTLNRRLMFSMRDLYIGYDGTVRNAYGNQLVQFCYDIEETGSPSNVTDDSSNDSTYGAMGGQPVGSLAACAISEAAYSALDQPISALETSPLLNLKKVLECGIKKCSGNKTASLFLSKKLGRWAYGFEYAALEVQSHLERLFFSEIVSVVEIFFSTQTFKHKHTGPWICHFEISKEIVQRRRLTVHSIVNALHMNCNFTNARSKCNLPKLQITSRDFSGVDMRKENSAKIFITVTMVEGPRNSSVQLATLQDFVIPFLLGTVVKGFPDFKKVDILWKDQSTMSRSQSCSSGELYLRVFMSENCKRTNFWTSVVDNCLPIMDMIDWERSHPDDIHDLTSGYGIDVAWKYFVTSLKSAIFDTGKTILLEHLLLAADCLSVTGEFLSLNAKGLAEQRKRTSVSSPFMQACFSNPASSLIKAAKNGVLDDLQGSLDSLSWGKIPSVGTGGHFNLLYSGKGHELAKPANIYKLLRSHSCSTERNLKVEVPRENNHMLDKFYLQPLCTYGDFNTKGLRSLKKSQTMLRCFLSAFQKLSQELKRILYKYPINHCLDDVDKKIVIGALNFHPRKNEKIGTGAQEIKVGHHSEHENTRCFFLVRMDGSVEDFSYHKCIHGALEMIAPERAKTYKSTWLNEHPSSRLPNFCTSETLPEL